MGSRSAALAHQNNFDIAWCRGSVSELLFAPVRAPMHTVLCFISVSNVMTIFALLLTNIHCLKFSVGMYNVSLATQNQCEVATLCAWELLDAHLEI